MLCVLDCFCCLQLLQVSYFFKLKAKYEDHEKPEEKIWSTNYLYLSSLLSTGRYAELQVEFASAVRTSAEQKELILKLEHDLSTIQAMSSLPRPDTEGSEVSQMGNIPEPIKEATAMFIGTSWN